MLTYLEVAEALHNTIQELRQDDIFYVISVGATPVKNEEGIGTHFSLDTGINKRETITLICELMIHFQISLSDIMLMLKSIDERRAEDIQ